MKNKRSKKDKMQRIQFPELVYESISDKDNGCEYLGVQVIPKGIKFRIPKRKKFILKEV
jgi:hypothetical protein